MKKRWRRRGKEKEEEEKGAVEVEVEDENWKKKGWMMFSRSAYKNIPHLTQRSRAKLTN